ncbi:MAG: LytTR family transcriptional regulator DNA-binding domain-containing protein [Bacteroidales bacterium]|jgi:hypothetical protein|nr:LytTR family transcriptional regulator DNA-binding domain-containing protein [Bacteroidales bacterium]
MKLNRKSLAIILENVRGWLKQPLPPLRNQWKFAAIVTAGVFLILSIISYFILEFTPVSDISFARVARFVGFHTLIAAVSSCVVVYLLPLLFPRAFGSAHSTKGQFLSLAVFLLFLSWLGISLYDYVLLSHYMNTPISFYKALYSNSLIVYMVGFLPVYVGFYWLKNRSLRTVLHETASQNEKLAFRLQKEVPKEQSLITLPSATKDTLTLFPHELVYLESSDNYVHIAYKVNDAVLQKTLRVTLRQVEDVLRDYPFLVRCHRAFMVNIYCVANLKGLKLWLRVPPVEIPISKTYRAHLVEQMKITDYSPQK